VAANRIGVGELGRKSRTKLDQALRRDLRGSLTQRVLQLQWGMGSQGSRAQATIPYCVSF